jgi:Asp-tRNA(Asn)/Glu-tRNA(Gln) amidotransferase C subunit
MTAHPLILPRRDVEKVAALARLSLSDAEIEHLRHDLGAVLGYAQRLAAIPPGDVVDPLPATDLGLALPASNRLADDHPEPSLPLPVVMALAPERFEVDSGGADPDQPPLGFFRVPKVLGGDAGGGGGSA